MRSRPEGGDVPCIVVRGKDFINHADEYARAVPWPHAHPAHRDGPDSSDTWPNSTTVAGISRFYIPKPAPMHRREAATHGFVAAAAAGTSLATLISRRRANPDLFRVLVRKVRPRHETPSEEFNMFGKKISLFRLFGFDVNIDLSWLLLAVLITWSLAVGVFPAMNPDLSSATYWWMGVGGALGLFLSIVLHELSHSIVARRYGIPMRGITLFIFGGVAEMDAEPPSPRSEFLMAIAGPAASVVIAGIFFALAALDQLFSWPQELAVVVDYLAIINLVLAAFNLIPAFPLDGGRVLRSVLWHFKGNLRWATRFSAFIGSGFGVAMIVLGVISLLFGNLIGGIWWFLIGMFLFGAARGSYQHLLMRRTFEGVPVRSFMRTDAIAVPRDIPITTLVDRYVYRHHFKMFPVVDGDHLWGCVTTRDIKQMPRDQWSNQTVGSITKPCGPDNTIGPDDDALQALAAMSRAGSSRLLVVEQDHLVGILSLKDLVGLLSVKLELDDAA
jgi:Zn-dependent protease/CBS domain-containing protein